MNNGRYREFMQADFDIVGQFPKMWADAEVLSTAIMCFKTSGLKDFKIILNHKVNLYSILRNANVPEYLFKSVSSSIDKLDKISWNCIKNELIDKGLNNDNIETIYNNINIKGSFVEVIQFINDKECKNEMSILLTIMQNMDLDSYIELDFSLARGLDYYTGIIFEIKQFNNISLGAGGRYDNLLETYGKKNVPIVGFSIGIDRLMCFLDNDDDNVQQIKILVATIGTNMYKHKLFILNK